jgi:hypothetical protein
MKNKSLQGHDHQVASFAQYQAVAPAPWRLLLLLLLLSCQYPTTVGS